MDFFEDYFYIIILIVGAIVQWLKSQSEKKQEKGYRRDEPEYDPVELEEFIREAEHRNPRPAVPPPLPHSGGALPGVGRSPVPDLQRKSAPTLQPLTAGHASTGELERQQELIEKAKQFKQAKSARKSKESKMPDDRRVPKARSSGIKGHLQSRAEIRSAFVLKELLDKPVGLR